MLRGFLRLICFMQCYKMGQDPKLRSWFHLGGELFTSKRKDRLRKVVQVHTGGKSINIILK